MNLMRRHLTYDQRVGTALKISGPLQEEAEKRKGGRPQKGFANKLNQEGMAGTTAFASLREQRRLVAQVFSQDFAYNGRGAFYSTLPLSGFQSNVWSGHSENSGRSNKPVVSLR